MFVYPGIYIRIWSESVNTSIDLYTSNYNNNSENTTKLKEIGQGFIPIYNLNLINNQENKGSENRENDKFECRLTKNGLNIGIIRGK